MCIRDRLTATSQHSASASEEISRTIEDIASGASSQAHSTEEGSEKAKLLGELIDKDANHLKNLNSAANRVKEAVDDGLVEIENLTAKTQESNQASQETVSYTHLDVYKRQVFCKSLIKR